MYQKEIKETVKEMKNSKSSGTDEITSKIVKNGDKTTKSRCSEYLNE